MQLQARLVHAEPGSRVVEVSAHRGPELLGSALGEASTAEQAEERAILRLQQRLAAASAPVAEPPPAPAAPAAPPAAVVAPAPRNSAPPPPTPALPQLPELPAATPPSEDPDDWSGELAQIDLELARIGWQRDQEATFLERAFGHPSRSRLTSYTDLLAYLRALQGLGSGADPAAAMVPLRRRDLLQQCDELLGRLHWDAAEGRRFLEQHFQLSSRQQLSDSQLLEFNMLLEGALIGV